MEISVLFVLYYVVKNEVLCNKIGRDITKETSVLWRLVRRGPSRQ